MRRIHALMQHPLTSTAFAVWLVVTAWRLDWWVLGFTAGIVTAIAINEWSSWYFDRWKERYHRERSSGEG